MKTRIASRISGWCAGLLLCLPIAQADETSILKLTPPNSVVVISIGSGSKLVERWNGGPFGKLFEDEEIKRYLAPMQKEGKEMPWDEASKAATGHTLRENLEIYKGAACFVLTGPTSQEDADTFFDKEDGPPMLILGEVGSDVAAYESYQAKVFARDKEEEGEGYEETTEEYLGVTLHLRKMSEEGKEPVIREGWAIVGETTAYSNSYDLLKSTVSKLKNPSEEGTIPSGLAGHRETHGPSDATFFLDTAALMPYLKTGFTTSMGESLKNNPMVSAASIWKALALENITGVAASLKLDPEQTEISSTLQHTGNNGVMSLLAYSNGALATPDLVPANASRAGTVRYSLAAMWDGIFTMLEEAGPGIAGMVRAQLSQFEETAGVNFRKDLIGGLGENIVMFEEIRKSDNVLEPQSDYLYAIDLVNRQGVESALTALRNFLGQGMAAFEERDVLGTKVYSFSMPIPQKNKDGEVSQSPMEITHAVTDRWLLVGIGSSRPMEKALSGLHTPGNTIWTVPAVKASLDAAGDSLASFEYANFSGILETILGAINSTQTGLPEDQRFVNPEAAPDAAVFTKYLGTTVTTFWEAQGALLSRCVLRGSSNE